MGRVIAGVLALFLSSCIGHVEPAVQPTAVASAAADEKTAFCSMAQQQMAHNETVSRAKAAEGGLDLKIKITECDLVGNSAGRIYYTLNTTMGEQPVLTVDSVAIIMRIDGTWTIVKDSPIYVINHVLGEFSWFVNEPLTDDDRGQDI